MSQAGVHVTIVEPDGHSGGLRNGVPQRQQLHALLDMGRTQLDRMFPHLTRDLVADGASLAAGEEIEMYTAGARKFGVPGNELVGVTRELLEGHVRRRVSAEKHVTTVRSKACGLEFTGPRISGILYREPHSGVVRELQADAVVDAMGRSSRAHAAHRSSPVPRDRGTVRHAHRRRALPLGALPTASIREAESAARWTVRRR
ncbi:hypothetical protein AB0B67_30450 [Streptomyces spectabilis]